MHFPRIHRRATELIPCLFLPAPHAAAIPPQPYETLCYALARRGDMKHLSVFFPNPSANPDLAQRLNRVLENND